MFLMCTYSIPDLYLSVTCSTKEHLTKIDEVKNWQSTPIWASLRLSSFSLLISSTSTCLMHLLSFRFILLTLSPPAIPMVSFFSGLVINACYTLIHLQNVCFFIIMNHTVNSNKNVAKIFKTFLFKIESTLSQKILVLT